MENNNSWIEFGSFDLNTVLSKLTYDGNGMDDLDTSSSSDSSCSSTMIVDYQDLSDSDEQELTSSPSPPTPPARPSTPRPTTLTNDSQQRRYCLIIFNNPRLSQLARKQAEKVSTINRINHHISLY